MQRHSAASAAVHQVNGYRARAAILAGMHVPAACKSWQRPPQLSSGYDFTSARGIASSPFVLSCAFADAG